MSDTAMRLLNDPIAFRDWLASQPAGRAFGFGFCHTCALARFLQEAAGGPYWVAERHFGQATQTMRYKRRLPAWARRFVHRYDRTPVGMATGVITAAQAAALLSQRPSLLKGS